MRLLEVRLLRFVSAGLGLQDYFRRLTEIHGRRQAARKVLLCNPFAMKKYAYDQESFRRLRVLSEKGKRLGGPYKTKEEAKKRLRQVEYF